MTSPLSEFVPVGPRTSLYTPSKPEDGQLVILCTWLGAGPRTIAKYIALYRRVAQDARILLIQSDVQTLISSYAYQRKAILPAVSIVLDRLSECRDSGRQEAGDKIGHRGTSLSSTLPTSTEKRPKILLQTFSNGGTNTAAQLLIVLEERRQSPLPLAGLLCDSGPNAGGSYFKDYDAMLFSLPKGVMARAIGAVACHCILILVHTWIAFGNENPASLQRRTLLDATVFLSPDESQGEMDVADIKGRVCYFYSKTDPMCHWEDVEAHARTAVSKGWQVRELVFDGSGHCAHFMIDEKRYAESVESIWEGARSAWAEKPMAKL